MNELLTSALALAILASVVIAIASFINTYTVQRYRTPLTAILLVLTAVYFVASTVFLVIGLL